MKKLLLGCLISLFIFGKCNDSNNNLSPIKVEVYWESNVTSGFDVFIAQGESPNDLTPKYIGSVEGNINSYVVIIDEPFSKAGVIANGSSVMIMSDVYNYNDFEK